jgi:hypothetical protein
MPTLRLGMAIIAAAIMLPEPLTAQQNNTPAQQSKDQQNAAQPSGPGAPNVTPSRRDEPGSSSATTGTPPIAGANSFTEGQAKDRIAKAGYTDVQNLKLDDKGIWRGKAHKSGQQVNVALDYRGNVVQQ